MRRCYQNPKNANCDSCWLRFPWREWNGGQEEQEDCGLGKLVINCSTHTNTHTHSLFGQSTDRWNVAIDGRTSRTGHFNLVCQRQTLTAECSSSCSQNWFAQRHLKPPRPVPSSPFLPQHRQMHRQRESERVRGGWPSASERTRCWFLISRCVVWKSTPFQHSTFRIWHLLGLPINSDSESHSVQISQFQIEIAARRKTQLMKPERLAHPILWCPSGT